MKRNYFLNKILKSMFWVCLFLSIFIMQVYSQSSVWSSVGPFDNNSDPENIGFLFAHPKMLDIIYAVIPENDKHLYVSYNAGETWNILENSPTDLGAVSVDPQNPNKIWVGDGYQWRKDFFVYKSIDNGQSWLASQFYNHWDPMNNTTMQVSDILIHPQHSDYILVAANHLVKGPVYGDGVFKRSLNDGESWDYLGGPTTCSCIDPANPGIVYRGTERSSYVKKYSDFWGNYVIEDITPVTGIGAVRDMEVDFNGSLFVAASDGLWKWNGSDWSVLSSFPGEDVKALAVGLRKTPGTVFVGTDSSGVFISIDSGTSWEEFNDGLDSLRITRLSINENYIYAGTDHGGVWRRPLSPISDFSANVNNGFKPLTVQFADSSLGLISTWQWDFGDGYSSVEQNPQHIYETADSFSVSLTVTGPGGSDTLTKKDLIIVTEPAPTANFIVDKTAGVVPLTVQFTDSSSGVVTSWQWDFGDGQSSTEANPKHIYETPDSFTVLLTVTGPGGSDTLIKEDYIIVAEPTPVANFTADISSGEVPLTVQFMDSSNGIITSWQWDFGDGQSSAKKNPLHIYQTVGLYTVSLAVSGPGGSDTLSRKDFIVVTEAAPVANFSADITSGVVPLTVHFTDSSSGTVSGWLWNFGDDSISTEQNPVHIYSRAGVYSVTQIVSNASLSDTLVKNDYISVSATEIKTDIAGIPNKYALYQNYPNPFNSKTVISYQLPVVSEVELSIYNLLGQKVTTLVSERQPAGKYKVQWPAGIFISGIYYYRLLTDNGFASIKKMILLK